MLVPVSQNRFIEKHRVIDRPKRILILGSTGSIGKSALEIIRNNRDAFEVVGLIAGSNVKELNTQIAEFTPKYAGLGLDGDLSQLDLPESRMVSGTDEISALAKSSEVDIVLAAVVGMAGLKPVVAALEADKVVALANKESLVAAGPIVAKIINSGRGAILPVDSEHSAIFQALQGHHFEDVSQLILTASGGPFLNRSRGELSTISPEQAVKHPRWNMGKKISIDSATMMNKALEVIEAFWLFGISAKNISVVVHPESIVHSLVEYRDGTQIAQLSNPDMKGPIGYAMSYPGARLGDVMKKMSLSSIGTLTFRPLCDERFPAVQLARDTISMGGFASAVFNSANEVAVSDFLNGKLSFDRIEQVVFRAVEEFGSPSCNGVDDLIALDKEVRSKFACK